MNRRPFTITHRKKIKQKINKKFIILNLHFKTSIFNKEKRP